MHERLFIAHKCGSRQLCRLVTYPIGILLDPGVNATNAWVPDRACNFSIITSMEYNSVP